MDLLHYPPLPQRPTPSSRRRIRPNAPLRRRTQSHYNHISALWVREFSIRRQILWPFNSRLCAETRFGR
uniref:Pentatricopeptide repeat-containing protein At1g05750ic n=1 Tax=Rhizophora mucronata TaxID=61149 RepID=A0A2P2QQ10_RHIMU